MDEHRLPQQTYASTKHDSDNAIRVELVAVEDSDALAPHLPQWHTLAQQALDINPYLMPTFMLAAGRHLLRDTSTSLLFLYQCSDAADKLLLVLPLRRKAATLALPCRHWVSKVYEHCYLGYPLIARDAAALALPALLRWFAQQRDVPLLLLNELPRHLAATQSLLNECQSQRHLCSNNYERPVLQRQSSYAAHIERLSASNRKRSRQLLHKLKTQGQVDIVFYDNHADRSALAQRFMTLEMSGWKGREGTALGASTGNSAFFTELVAAADDDLKLFFTEIVLNGKPLAMTANFLVADQFYAFKVAVDENYHKFAPGIAVEFVTLELLYEHSTFCRGDSGAAGDSHLQAIWADVTTMSTLYIPNSSSTAVFAWHYLRTLQRLKWLSRQLKSAPALRRQIVSWPLRLTRVVLQQVAILQQQLARYGFAGLAIVAC